jgi:hypothetical protein
MTVATYYDLAGLSNSQLRSYYMNNPLVRTVQAEQRNFELFTVFSQGIDLKLGKGVCDGQRTIPGGNIVVRGRIGQVGPPDLSSCQSQTLKGLSRSDLMHQMAIDVKDGWLPRLLVNHMPVPDFFK